MHEAEGLRETAAQLIDEAEALRARAKELVGEAGKLRSRADRLDHPERAVRVTTTALDRARGDKLLAAAGVAVESLTAGFTVGDLAAALEIHDEARAMRLLLAVAEFGHVHKLASGGWAVASPAEAHVRDYVTEAGTFTLADVVELGYTELEASRMVNDLRDAGVVEGAGGHYTYVEVEGESPAREDRRPPELEPPAGTERRASGTPVRVVNHGQRGKQMQGGSRRHVIRRDQNRERAEAAREAKAAARATERAVAKNARGVRRK